MTAKTFEEFYSTYEVYHDYVVAALVKTFGDHTAVFWSRRYTYESFFAERKSPEEVVAKYREDFGR